MDIKRRRGRPSGATQLDREQLLQLALRAFARRGFDGVRLSALAREAGIANSLLNYYFESKEDLWKQSVQYGFEKMKDKFREVYKNFKDLKGIPLIKVQVRQLVYFSAEFPEYFVVFCQEMAIKSERADWLMEHLYLPFQEKVDQIYLKEQAEGKIKDIGVHHIMYIMLGAANTFFLNKYFLEKQYGVNPFQEDQIEQHADAVIEVLFNGMINPQPKNSEA